MYKHEDTTLYFTNPNEIHWKPGAKSKDKSKTLLMPYGETRDYMLRLDKLDPQWMSQLKVTHAGNRVVFVSSITLNGITRESSGDALLIENDKDSVLAGTNAEAQAFKRTCAEHNIGRELYFTDAVWVKSDEAMDYVWGNKIAQLKFNGVYSFLNDLVTGGQKKEKAVTTERPYLAETVHEKVQERIAIHLSKETLCTVTDRKVLASILDAVLGDKTKRYELSTWLVGQASSKKMKQADVNALFDWLGVRQFGETPDDVTVKEIHSAHTAALKASGQQELI